MFDAWNAQIVGSKLWLVFTKEEMGAVSKEDNDLSGSFTNLFEWTESAIPHMATKPQRCLVAWGASTCPARRTTPPQR